MSEQSAPHPVPSQINILALLEHSDRYVTQYRKLGRRSPRPLTSLLVDPRMRSSISIQREVIKAFVSVNEVQLGTRAEDNCLICLNTLAAAIAEEEIVIASDTPISSDVLGVVKLETCTHHFCRKCISQWARSGNMRCPACRTPFFGAAQQAEVGALEEMMGFGSTPGTTEEEAEARSERVARLVEDVMLQQNPWSGAAPSVRGVRESNMYS